MATNIPDDGSVASSLARNTEAILDHLVEACRDAEDWNALTSVKFLEELYDQTLQGATDQMGYDVQLIAHYGDPSSNQD